MGPTDICTGGNSVTLSVVSPQAGYTYSWFVGSYGCFATGLPNPYSGFGMNTGTSLQVYGTGEFYCIGAPAT